MFETYAESWPARVTREEARREIANHDSDGFAAFLIDCGDAETYDSAVVLDWLGY
jgi:hypothetical protein